MSKSKVILTILLVLLFAGSVAGGYYYFNKYQETKTLLENPEEAAKLETSSLLEKVGNLMELPQGEPTIATILDKDKLADQPFFINAQNGDKVLIFAESQIAILFRPSTNKIVTFAPVSIGDPEGQQVEEIQTAPEPTEEPVTDEITDETL